LRSSLSKREFLRQAFTLVRGAEASDFEKGRRHPRPARRREGKLVDDITIERKGDALHVLNAVSPGLTCCLPFADYLAEEIS